MSRKPRRGDDYAPAMFPFLAVLLCTIGALVLILVISVVHSHASAKRDMDNELQPRLDEAQEESDYLHSISDELSSRREKVKREIERRRRELEHVEDHMLRLQRELEGLLQQAERMADSSGQDETARAAREAKIDELRRAIEDKERELTEEIERQKNRKPAFSIIPYDGPNGTTRRPVYLECRADGLLIQPEGIRISIQDLQPPYGPGNPVDAALRVLRTAYQQRDATFGLNIPPYPLLIVRPDGIHTYAMARAAMSGWDDQFGYELVDADMELAFPPGVPSLASDLNTSLDAARKRQQLLVASLPRQYVRSRELENMDFDSLNPDSQGSTESAAGGGRGWGDEPKPNAAATGSDSSQWTMIQELRPGQVVAGQTNQPQPMQEGNGARNPTGRESTSASPALSSMGSWGGADLSGEYQAGTGEGLTPMQSAPNRASGWESTSAGSGSAASPQSGGGYSPTSSQPGMAGNTSGGTLTGGTAGQPAAAGGEGNSSVGSSDQPSGNANSFQSSQDAPLTQTSSGNPSQGGGGGALSATGSSSPTPDPESQPGELPNASVQWNAPSNSKSSGNSQEPRRSHDQNGSGSSDSDSKPISASRGRGWATSRNETKATPVSRPIRMVVLQDRWMIRKEGSETQFDVEIDLQLGPHHASQSLEKGIRERVDSWGLSLPGGYWTPSLTVESASDAEQSVQRLKRLLEGSGVELQVVPLQPPPKTSTRPRTLSPR